MYGGKIKINGNSGNSVSMVGWCMNIRINIPEDENVLLPLLILVIGGRFR